MKNTQRKTSNRRWIALLLVAAVGLALLLFFKRDALDETWRALLSADLRYVILLPMAQVINYLFIGLYYRGMFQEFGAKIGLGRAWGVVSAMNFVNQILPSGGLSGITYLAYGFRTSMETGKTTLVQLGRYIFAFMSYMILMPFALLQLVQEGDTAGLQGVLSDIRQNPQYLLVVIAFIVFGWLVFASLFSHQLRRIVANVLDGLNWIVQRIFRRKHPIDYTPVRKMKNEFYSGIEFIRSGGWSTLRPSIFMFLSATTELAIVYISLLAVGAEIGIGAVFVAFIAANIVGVVSIIPGDVGVHEAAVIIVLAGFGVPEALAVSATLLYRVFNKMIFLPIGFYFYQRLLKPVL